MVGGVCGLPCEASNLTIWGFSRQGSFMSAVFRALTFHPERPDVGLRTSIRFSANSSGGAMTSGA